MNKTVQYMKVEIESIQKTQNERNLENQNLRAWTGASPTIQEMEERLLRIEDTTEEMDTSVKENKC